LKTRKEKEMTKEKQEETKNRNKREEINQGRLQENRKKVEKLPEVWK